MRTSESEEVECGFSNQTQDLIYTVDLGIILLPSEAHVFICMIGDNESYIWGHDEDSMQ